VEVPRAAFGMIMALETVFGKNGDRLTVSNAMIVITDGEEVMSL
jgi:hypothetical protein